MHSLHFNSQPLALIFRLCVWRHECKIYFYPPFAHLKSLKDGRISQKNAYSNYDTFLTK